MWGCGGHVTQGFSSDRTLFLETDSILPNFSGFPPIRLPGMKHSASVCARWSSEIRSTIRSIATPACLGAGPRPREEPAWGQSGKNVTFRTGFTGKGPVTSPSNDTPFRNGSPCSDTHRPSGNELRSQKKDSVNTKVFLLRWGTSPLRQLVPERLSTTHDVSETETVCPSMWGKSAQSTHLF